MKKPILLVSLLTIGLFSVFIACQDGQPAAKEVKATTTVEEEEEEMSEEELYASRLYKKHCTSCHEASMKAFVDRDWKQGNSWNEVHQSIIKGHANISKAAAIKTISDADMEKLTDQILIALEKRTIESFDTEANWTGTIQSEAQTFKLDTIAQGLEIPWGLAFLPNGDVLVTDRNGKFYRQREGAAKQEIKGVPEVRYKGQGGLLDVTIHPDFANNQTVYLAYAESKGAKESTTIILKAKLHNDELVAQKTIMEVLPYHTTRNHYGSRMVFDKDGYLFIAIGDRQNRDQYPQDLSVHPGKIHRLNADGSVPKDNPFVNTPNALPSIWSYGHRNPQGLVYDKATGTMWESEHAPRGGDEINIIQKGLNYGWPVISYGIDYKGTKFTKLTEQEGMEQPVHYYMPSTGTCGLTLVTGDKYPNWKGDLLAGSLRFRYLSRLKMDGAAVVGEERLLESIGRVRVVEMGEDGYIYIGVENPGFVFRLKPV